MPKVCAGGAVVGRKHSSDVATAEGLKFSELMLSKEVYQGLCEAGYERPSPIQLQAIPLGRFGVGRTTLTDTTQHMLSWSFLFLVNVYKLTLLTVVLLTPPLLSHIFLLALANPFCWRLLALPLFFVFI